MKKLRMLLVPLCLGAFVLQPALASEHAGCGPKDVTSTVQKTVSMNYLKEVSQDTVQMKKQTSTTTKNKMYASKEGKLEIIKLMLKKASMSNLEKVKNKLTSLSTKISSTNPNYYMIELLSTYIDDLLADQKNAKSIVDIVVNTPQVSILKEIVVLLDLGATLSSEGPFTVFAPTNEAFEKLLADLGMTFDELAANKELLKTVVLYHVIGSKVPASDVVTLTEGTLVPTVGGESLRVSNRDGVKVDASNVITTDIMASNGVIHLIDEVLLPPSVRTTLGLPVDRGAENIVTTAVNNGTFTTLVAAVQAAGLVDVLSGEGPFTVFAPTNEAFAALLAELNMSAEELLADTALLIKVLTYHVVPGFYTADDVVSLTGPTPFGTAEGSSVIISPNNGSPVVNESNIVLADVYASNGVIHVIDKVLIPTM